MLKYPHPRLERSSMLDWEDLTHHTRRVKNGLSPSEYIVQHFDAVKGSFHGKPNVAVLGLLLEVCVWDALARFDISILAWGADLSGNGKHADADILVRPKDTAAHPFDVALLIKTSLRERWKQLDRDAMIMERAYRAEDGSSRPLQVRAMFLREKDTDSVSTAQRKARTVQRQLGAPNTQIFTLMDQETVTRLFTTLGANLV